MIRISLIVRSSAIIFFTAFLLSAFAQTEPSAGDILKKMRAQFELIDDYTADLGAVINFEKVRIPKMEAKIFFKQPDKIHVEPKEGSFAMFPRDVIGFNPTELVVEKYDAVVQGREMVGNINCYKVKLLAKADTMRLQRLMLFVDPQYWVVKKLSTTPDRGGSAEAMFEHQLIDNKYIMPTKITLSIDVPGIASMKQTPGAPQQMEEKKGTVIVTYKNYKVNTGLSDELFLKKKGNE